MIPPSPHMSSGYPSTRLLAPEEAHDFAYWDRRLVESGLLHDAVAVAIFRPCSSSAGTASPSRASVRPSPRLARSGN